MQIRWKKLRVPLVIAADATVALSGVITYILTRPVIYCYDEDNPEQIYWGAKNCLPEVEESTGRNRERLGEIISYWEMRGDTTTEMRSGL
jgi:hypothetical protein